LITLIYFWRERFHLRHLPIILLHMALDIMLLGALVTHYTSEEGKIHLRADLKPRSSYEAKETGKSKNLPFEMLLKRFEVTTYEGSGEPSNYISHIGVMVPGKEGLIEAKVSMNHIAEVEHYRFCQSGYDPDERGTYLLINHDPWGIGITYTGYALLLAAILFSLLTKSMRGFHVKKIWVVIVLIITVLFAVVFNICSERSNPIPILRSPLLGIHVIVIMISYTLFLTIMIIAIVALIKKQEERLYRTSRYLLYPAVFLLTIGIFIGAVWANVSWGNYWSWDPKETWALITMIIYAMPIHCVSLKWFRRPHLYHIYMLFAFTSVLITYYGVNYFMSGMHSYA